MKALAVLLAVLAGVWLAASKMGANTPWRRGQRLQQKPARPQAPTATSLRVLPMVRCARCGTHLPSTEVIVGRHGSYCCFAHRQEAEGE